MIEASYRMSFSLESFDECRIRTEGGGKNFKCNDSVQRNLACLVDQTHPAPAEEGFDFVVTQFDSRKLLDVHFAFFFSRRLIGTSQNCLGLSE